MAFERKWIKFWSPNQISFFSERKRKKKSPPGKHFHMVLHFYVWGLKRSWKRRLCVENVSCTDTDKSRQDTVFLKKQLFPSVSSLASFELIKIVKTEKAHILGYHGRDTYFYSLPRNPEYWKLNTVWQPASPSRDDDAETAFVKIAKKTVLAFPCFSCEEAVDLIAITWSHPLMVSLSLALENIAVLLNTQLLPQKLLISKEQ